MQRHLALVLFSTFLFAACQRDAEPQQAAEPAPAAPAPDTTDTAADPAAGIDATAVIDRAPVAGASADFDAKAFAGAFGAPGTHLQIESDGSYRLSVHAESADADLVTTGSWSLEADDSELLLDPDSKDETDRRYDIVSQDELRAVEGGQVLRRDGA